MLCVCVYVMINEPIWEWVIGGRLIGESNLCGFVWKKKLMDINPLWWIELFFDRPLVIGIPLIRAIGVT